MNDVEASFRRMRREGKLPGLMSGMWDGHILLDCVEGFPVLIPVEA